MGKLGLKMGKLSPNLGIWESKRRIFDLKKDKMEQKWEFRWWKGKIGNKKRRNCDQNQKLQ